jgi:hypothetical protein
MDLMVLFDEKGLRRKDSAPAEPRSEITTQLAESSIRLQ